MNCSSAEAHEDQKTLSLRARMVPESASGKSEIAVLQHLGTTHVVRSGPGIGT